MIELPKRTFDATPAVRLQVPLWVGLFGPSGGGKTYTALRLAKGLQSVQGGPIYGVDTEAKRMLHYADKFDFTHVPFEAPYGSLDYLAAIKFCLKHNTTGKRPTVIVDSMSHEHEGPGGMMELQDQIATRMATRDGQFDPKRYEKIKMLAWAEPKARRRALINGMLGLEANFILCFRAKDSSKPVQKVEQKRDGGTFTKTEVVHQGFVPIGGDDFVYECTLAALLLPGAKGVPSWRSDNPGERVMIKLPEQFQSLEKLEGRQLDEDIGAQLATWADGASAARSGGGAPAATNGAPKPTNGGGTKAKAAEWVEWFKGELAELPPGEVLAFEDECRARLDVLKDKFPDLYRDANNAAADRMAAG